MPGYRFCRSDDIPLLVEAYETCFRVHFPDEPPMTVERYKRAVREIELWPSSCMVAIEDRQPIGVLYAAKRDTANCIQAIGVRPDRLGQGHGGHMLTSLASKLAILGPPRILAELPASNAGVVRLFERGGYRGVGRTRDWVAAGPSSDAAPRDLVVPVSCAELESAGLIDEPDPVAWIRSRATLTRLDDKLRGLGIAAGDRIAAWLLFRDDAGTGRREILRVAAGESDRAEPLARMLVDAARADAPGEIALPRVSEAELPARRLEAWGFRAGAEYDARVLDIEPVASW